MCKSKSIIFGLVLIFALSLAAFASMQSSPPAITVVPQTDFEKDDGYFLIKTGLPDSAKSINATVTAVIEKGDAYLVHAYLLSRCRRKRFSSLSAIRTVKAVPSFRKGSLPVNAMSAMTLSPNHLESWLFARQS